MLAQRGVANCIAPIDQSLLQPVIHRFQARGRFGEPHGRVDGTRQGVRQGIIEHIGPNSPIRTRTNALFEGIDHLTLAERAHLIVDEIEHAIGVTAPIRFWLFLRLELSTRVADENSAVALP